ncbi:TPA: hypothetical protein N0F65_003299 [Lagenidium giganteum]|uniref:Transmembrane protein n=1 Tax=Lagenidium giganteum TaxID=4803 RepID=A0AAV2YXF9_9STRA|nr:TPA: hypothetical protein N0F65_003299 [Lagenidium giganteum]
MTAVAPRHAAARDVDVRDAAVALVRWRYHRTHVIDRLVPFSWLRLIGSVISYLLLCSDAIRSGPGHRGVPHVQPMEPSTAVLVGPWSYPVMSLQHNDTSDDVAVWAYKYDTTSIAWRTFLSLLNVTTAPRCIASATDCPSVTLPRSVVFHMIDEFVGSVARSHRITARCSYRWADRLHHHVLPALFSTPWKRTNQAVHLSPRELEQGNSFASICSLWRQRLLLCDDIWARFDRYTAHVNEDDRMFAVATDILHQYAALRQQYQRAVIDLLVLTSLDDSNANRGGFMAESFRRFDVTTIFRVRACAVPVFTPSGGDPANELCQTLNIEEHRYEGALYMTNAAEWYPYVLTLRVVAQSYFVLRLVLLFGGSYVARRQETQYRNAPLSSVVAAAVRTVAKLPCQGIVYGSLFPVVCYVLAHCIDAPLMYTIVSRRFTTPSGTLPSFGLVEGCFILAVQMRSVWLLALALHLVTWLRTRGVGWSASYGIVGLPEYWLSAVSAVTVLAQYRLLAFRTTEVIDVTVHAPLAQHNLLFHATSAHGAVVRDGVLIDVKCLLVLVPSVFVASFVVKCVLSMIKRRWCKRVGILWSRTFVPYSAGALWTPTAFNIYWGSDLFPAHYCVSAAAAATKGAHVVPEPSSDDVLQLDTDAKNSSADDHASGGHGGRLWWLGAAWSCVRNRVHGQRLRMRTLQRQMERVHERTDDAQALVVLMNLFAMTDPWMFVRLRWGRGVAVVFLRHRSPTGDTVCCVPLTTVVTDHVADVPWAQMDVLVTTSTRDMTWSDLLHCG